MAEDLHIAEDAPLEERYQLLLKQAASLMETEDDQIANLANLSSLLKLALNPLWVGFYRMVGSELVLGPFQGPLGCTRIPLSRGVCGACASRQETIVVPDVEQFPGHIACSADSRSEIVVPILSNGKVELVLDLDSEKLNNYNETDVQYLEEFCRLIAAKHFGNVEC